MTMTMQERGRLGGRATFAKYGREFYVANGRAGFRAAIDAGWGAYLAEHVLGASYRAKFGREPQVKEGRNKAGDAARAQARRDHPTLGVCQWPGCTALATERHHIDGWKVSDFVTGLCDTHHTEFHQAYRQSRTLWRNHDDPTPRAVAIAIGIGLDDATPF